MEMHTNYGTTRKDHQKNHPGTDHIRQKLASRNKRSYLKWKRLRNTNYQDYSHVSKMPDNNLFKNFHFQGLIMTMNQWRGFNKIHEVPTSVTLPKMERGIKKPYKRELEKLSN